MYFAGLFTVLVTPFNEQGMLDEEGLRQNIRFQILNQVDGLVTLGTTSESPTLTYTEKERVVQICLEEIQDRIPLIVGTGTYSTAQTIENTCKAKRLGASGALIVTPYYNKPTQEGLYRHFKSVAEAVNIPIILYNIAGRTGQNLSLETLKRLADIPNIVGVKESSGNLFQIMDVIETMRTFRPEFSVLSGDDILTFPILSLGGHGVFSVVSNLIPHQVKEMLSQFKEGNLPAARDLHYALSPLFKNAFIETNPIPIKRAMTHWEMAAGSCRLPLCDMSSENEKAWISLLNHYENFRPVTHG